MHYHLDITHFISNGFFLESFYCTIIYSVYLKLQFKIQKII